MLIYDSARVIHGGILFRSYLWDTSVGPTSVYVFGSSLREFRDKLRNYKRSRVGPR